MINDYGEDSVALCSSCVAAAVLLYGNTNTGARSVASGVSRRPLISERRNKKATRPISGGTSILRASIGTTCRRTLSKRTRDCHQRRA